MEKILKGYVFRLYPTKEQLILIEKSIGCSRFIYNYFLNISKEEKINAYNYIKKLPELINEYIWLKEVDSCLLRTSIFNLDNAYQKYFKETKGLPKFKSKTRSRQSYRTNNITRSYKGKTYNSIELDLNKKIIKLPKLKEVSIKGYRNLKQINGKIINATIYKEVNRYYVSICVEEYIIPPIVIPKTIIGIDLGIKNLVITSDGKVYNNQKYITKYEKKIKGLQKWLSRSQKGSKNREKIKLKLTRVYQKLKNARKYLIHQISKEITEENDIIVAEKLKISQMVKNSHFSKQIYDASWQELIRCISYKSKWKNKKFYQIDTSYPSSQICSHCGYKNKELKNLNIRNWECPKCQSENERDINASINIMNEGLRKYMDELQFN